MTRLKIEVVGEDDADAQALTLALAKRMAADLLHHKALCDVGYAMGFQYIGNATATVEREETTEAI